MTEEQKKEVAVFRFSVIHDFVGNYKLDYGEQEGLLKEKSDRKWRIPYSHKTSLSRTTVLRWVRQYQAGGGKLASLYPQDRNDQGHSRVLDKETRLALTCFRKKHPRMPVPHLISLMKKQQTIGGDVHLPLTTVYRFFHKENLMITGNKAVKDRRKFEAEMPNDIWQADVMHGPRVEVAGKQKKTYLIAFIDDHSRLIPHAEFFISENLACFMNAFQQALLKRGLPRMLYVDNGSAFRAKQLEYTAAALGMALVHSKPYTPQGRGKIERFFRTIRTEFLPGFMGETLDELNECLDLWLADVYHQRSHSSTGQNPFTRFTKNLECLRPVPDNLKDFFRKVVRRRVNKDRSVIVDKRLYEAPVELIGKQVEILFHEDHPETVEIKHQRQSYGMLSLVDLHVNCRVSRDKNCQVKLLFESTEPESGKIWEE